MFDKLFKVFVIATLIVYIYYNMGATYVGYIMAICFVAFLIFFIPPLIIELSNERKKDNID